MTDIARTNIADDNDLLIGSVGDYFALLKPRVMSLVVFTALVGMVAAPGGINPVIAITALLAIAAAAVLLGRRRGA